MTKGMGLVFLVAVLPVAGTAQEQAPSGLTGRVANTPELAQQFAEDRQFLETTFRETRNAFIALTAIDDDILAPRYPQSGAGFAERVSEYSDAQAQFIEEYADTMALRTEALFEFREAANNDRLATFFQAESIYPIIVANPDIKAPEEPGNAIDIPGEFPGLELPDGGFFAQATN